MISSLTNNKKIKLLFAPLFAAVLIFSAVTSFNGINAQPSEPVTISLDSITYGPLTSNPSANQVKTLVDFQVNDLSLIGTTINGVMEVFAPNGTQIKTSSYPNGFTAVESSTVQFATSFSDPALTTLKVNVTLTDANKTNPISNTISTDVGLTV